MISDVSVGLQARVHTDTARQLLNCPTTHAGPCGRCRVPLLEYVSRLFNPKSSLIDTVVDTYLSLANARSQGTTAVITDVEKGIESLEDKAKNANVE